MVISHKGKKPEVHASAYIAPSATICGDVTIGPNCRVMHGASIIAEGGRIMLGEQCIILENAVVRSNTKHSTTIGNYALIGPNAHVVGCTIEDEVFIADGFKEYIYDVESIHYNGIAIMLQADVPKKLKD